MLSDVAYPTLHGSKREMNRGSPTAAARRSSLLRVAIEELAWPVDIADGGEQQQSRTAPT